MLLSVRLASVPSAASVRLGVPKLLPVLCGFAAFTAKLGRELAPFSNLHSGLEVTN